MPPVLVLNASYEPISVVSTLRAVTLVAVGRCHIVERAGDSVVRTAGGLAFETPSVIRLTYMATVPRDRVAPYTRAGLRARDRGVCQVAGCDRAGSTVDHVVPQSRGGQSTWENTVLMCAAHNNRKADRSLSEAGFRLKATPVAPRYEIMLAEQAARRTGWSAYLPAVS